MSTAEFEMREGDCAGGRRPQRRWPSWLGNFCYWFLSAATHALLCWGLLHLAGPAGTGSPGGASPREGRGTDSAGTIIIQAQFTSAPAARIFDTTLAASPAVSSPATRTNRSRRASQSLRLQQTAASRSPAEPAVVTRAVHEISFPTGAAHRTAAVPVIAESTPSWQSLIPELPPDPGTGESRATLPQEPDPGVANQPETRPERMPNSSMPPGNGKSGTASLSHGSRKGSFHSTTGSRSSARHSTSFFGAAGSGRAFVYVIDCSGSMSSRSILERARGELLASLAALPPTALIQVIYYNEEPQAAPTEGSATQLLRNSAAQRMKLEQFSRSVVVGGGTNHLAALELAIRFDPHAIFWLTDGDEPSLSGDELRQLQRRNRRGIPIHAVEFGYGPALVRNSFLRQAAQASGGEYQYRDLAAEEDTPQETAPLAPLPRQTAPSFRPGRKGSD